ncbi:flavin reductase family protein [Maribellus sp. CM-23]|uniref:flavin reductase family protein n=1 Tax=Maribellus sp. CM-23 TaxID=2781026 RepID=UPI001F479E3D|nr:flavin reductase family protein [Maribellus sp. CM-23]MCE4564394.1 flavin reductase family protein [Maribellus sp. CM-23]
MSKINLDLNSPNVLKLAWLLSNGQIMLLTSTNKEKTINGIITLGWCNPTSFEPFLVIASIGSGGKETGDRAYRYCYSLINETKEFGINVPTPDLTEAIVKIGTSHSNEVDKFKETGLTPLHAGKISAPLIEECFLNVECKVTDQFITGDHTVFVAEPVQVFVNDDLIVDGRFSDKYVNKNNQLHMGDFVSMWNAW